MARVVPPAMSGYSVIAAYAGISRLITLQVNVFRDAEQVINARPTAITTIGVGAPPATYPVEDWCVDSVRCATTEGANESANLHAVMRRYASMGHAKKDVRLTAICATTVCA